MSWHLFDKKPIILVVNRKITLGSCQFYYTIDTLIYFLIKMKRKLVLLLALALLCAPCASFAQRVVENARREAMLVPARGVASLPDRKACAVANRSPDRTITVRVEESVLQNDYLEKKIREVAKIGPREQKFIGYTGCDADALGQKCVGYKIIVAYYDEVRVVPHMKATSPMAAHPRSGEASGLQGDNSSQGKSN